MVAEQVGQGETAGRVGGRVRFFADAGRDRNEREGAQEKHGEQAGDFHGRITSI
jgi:hypothetical protein